MQSMACINSLYRLALNCAQVDFPKKAFNIIHPVVEFDSAGWGESSDKINVVFGALNKTCSNLIMLLDEYNSLSFAKLILNRPGNFKLKMVNLCFDRLEPDLDPEFKVWGSKYNIRNILHTVTLDEKNIQAYSIALWRSKPSNNFDDIDIHSYETIVPHLVESFRLCRRLQIQQQLTKSSGISQAYALCNQHGRILDSDEDFIQILKNDCPGWRGTYLPDELIVALKLNSDFILRYGLYRWKWLDDTLFISAMSLDKFQNLTNRELQVAYNYSTGQSYKAIAELLSIAPVTVRNHISNIYRKLDIHNKELLMQLFD